MSRREALSPNRNNAVATKHSMGNASARISPSGSGVIAQGNTANTRKPLPNVAATRTANRFAHLTCSDTKRTPTSASAAPPKRIQAPPGTIIPLMPIAPDPPLNDRPAIATMANSSARPPRTTPPPAVNHLPLSMRLTSISDGCAYVLRRSRCSNSAVRALTWAVPDLPRALVVCEMPNPFGPQVLKEPHRHCRTAFLPLQQRRATSSHRESRGLALQRQRAPCRDPTDRTCGFDHRPEASIAVHPISDGPRIFPGMHTCEKGAIGIPVGNRVRRAIGVPVPRLWHARVLRERIFDDEASETRRIPPCHGPR
jgi:hypothetical protein